MIANSAVSLLQNRMRELADAASCNLAFSHRKEVLVSYGEETITETNLLELRRCAPKSVTLKTFTRKQEAQNGSDWEWHFIGSRRVLRMRVQAKRMTMDGKLKIRHRLSKSNAGQSDWQIERLIAKGKSDNVLTMYCIYSTERQRAAWTVGNQPLVLGGLEAGCLLVDAATVNRVQPVNLGMIEQHCFPWHLTLMTDPSAVTSDVRTLVSKIPSIGYLNGEEPGNDEYVGVVKYNGQDPSASEPTGDDVRRLIVYDVRPS